MRGACAAADTPVLLKGHSAAASLTNPMQGRGMKQGSIAVLIAASALAAPAAAADPEPAAAPAAPTAQQLLVARVAGMHMAATLYYRGIRTAVSSDADVTRFFHEAEGLAYWGAAIPGLFPAGSGGGDSRARPEIWSNRADFEQKAADLRTAAGRLLQRARAGDRPGFATEAITVEAACNACHQAYRTEG